MRAVASPRKLVAAFAVVAVVLGLSSLGAAARIIAAAAKAPKTVNATLITRVHGTLAAGSKVRSSAVAGQRVFTDAKHGFALASVGSADYPVATADGGKTWKTDGPALHLDAAQAPLAVFHRRRQPQDGICLGGRRSMQRTTVASTGAERCSRLGCQSPSCVTSRAT